MAAVRTEAAATGARQERKCRVTAPAVVLIVTIWSGAAAFTIATTETSGVLRMAIAGGVPAGRTAME